MKATKADSVGATRGAFAVLTRRAIEKIRAAKMTAAEAAAHFESGSLGPTDYVGPATMTPKLVDMLIARVRQARKEERRTWGEGD